MTTEHNLRKSTLLFTFILAVTVAQLNLTFAQQEIIVGKPDLTVQIQEVKPNPVLAGHVLSVKWKVTNQGTAQAVRSKSAIKVANGDWIEACSVPSLDARRSHTCESPQGLIVAPLTQGTYSLWVSVDADSANREINERNNRARFELTVLPAPPQPDLVLSEFRSATSANIGEKIDVYYKIINAGLDTAGANSICFRIIGPGDAVVLEETISVPSLPPGIFSNGQWPTSGYTPRTAGKYTIRAEGDCLRQVNESNDDNNSATVTVKVQ
jgi:subtilase family serine protease